MVTKYISFKTPAFIIILFASFAGYAQNVGINSTGNAPAASAGLDVSFTDKGLLIPRVALTATGSAGPISSPATSLLVYNTATASDVTPGYYYWTGSAWSRLNSGTLTGWSTTGNASTTAGTNFLGTTDAIDFVIKTNNLERLRLLSDGKVGIGTTLPSTPLHVYSASSNLLYLQNPTGGAGTQANIAFKTYTGAGAPTALISAIDDDFSANLTFSTKIPGADVNALSEKMRIATTGEVGIGTNAPDASSALDVSSTSKGLLIPRVALTATNSAGPITSPATSLLVYNTATAGTNPNNVTPGYYYWSGSWTRLASGGTLTNQWTTSTNDIYTNTTGNVGIGTGSAVTFTNNEKVLINIGATTTTNTLLAAKGSRDSYLQFNIQNTSTGTSASTDIVASNNTGTTEATMLNYINMGINSTANTTTGVLGGAGNAYLHSTGNDLSIGNSTNGKYLRFFTNSGSATERLRVHSSGNIGIGTTANDNASTEAKVAITANTDQYTGLSITGDTDDYFELNIQNTGNASGGDSSTDIVATANDGDETDNYINMGINSSSYRAFVSGNARLLNGPHKAYIYSTGKEFYIGNSTGDEPLVFFTNSSADGDVDARGKERMRISGDDGEVLIGDIADNTVDKGNYLLQVNGDVTTGLIVPKANNTHNLGSTGLRWSTIYAQNALNTPSDRRLKTNISNLTYGLKEIMAMQPVIYNWKATPDGNKIIGLIAQEVKQILPEVVHGNEAKETLSMSNTDIIPVLINAIKEQQKQIETQQKQIDDLKKSGEKNQLLIEALLKKNH